jgi:beta-lactam-binding protein with PASTA domain
MWADAMRAIQDLLPDLDFVRPIKTRSSPDLSIVPNVVGMTVDDARHYLEGLGFSVSVVGQVNSDLQAGLVGQTSPAGGSTVYSGSTISLYTSTGTAAPATSPPTPGGGTTTGPGNGNGNGHGHH